MNKEEKISDFERETLKFLERDFNQCFQQTRHYDLQLFNILKLVFTGYTAVIGIALGLYQFGLEKGINISLPAKAILSIGFLFGLWVLMILGGAIAVIVLGPISISGYGYFDYILTSGLKSGIAIILVILWVIILQKISNLIFRKKFNF